MELKNGYKQTEVGVIPEDWNSVALKNVVWFQEGPGLRNWQFKSSGLKVINVTNLQLNGFLDLSKTDRHISWQEFDKMYKHFLINENDVVVASSGNSYCKTALVRKVDLPLLMNTSVIRFKPIKNITFDYMYVFLKSYLFKTQIDFLITGGAQPNFGPAHLKKIFIPLPCNLAEQTAIANALSDADSYISSLEKLIEKKRQIKQGSMQELMKPKDGWVWKKLGDIGKTYGGLSGKSKDDFKDGVFPYIPFMNIMTNPVIDLEFLDFVNLKTGESQNSAQIGDLFFNGSSETPEEVGMCSILQDEVPNLYLNSFCFGYRLKKELNINGLYLTYYFRSKEGRKLFFSMAQGATRYNLSKSNFNRLEVPIPTIEEQNSIANTLRDMDFDIKLHEEKLDKARSIKQGMMQQLLTGKIRII